LIDFLQNVSYIQENTKPSFCLDFIIYWHWYSICNKINL